MDDNINPEQQTRPQKNETGGKMNREEMIKVAIYQKVILLFLLLSIITIIFQFVLPQQLVPFLAIPFIGIGIASAVFIFLLAIRLYGTAAGVIFGILALIPYLGVIIILIVNGKATNTLKGNGIRVGLLGANLSDI